MRNLIYAVAISGLLLGSFASAQVVPPSSKVAIYTGTTQWIAKGVADAEAKICMDKLAACGITQTTWYQLDTEMDALADWVTSVTDNGQVDVLVLYGDFPPTLYAQGNVEPDGSIAELFIESTDGDAIVNHADYMFWGLGGRNNEGGLQNMMDIPGIVMWDDNTPMEVTTDGKSIAPSLTNFMSDRPFHIDQLPDDGSSEWAVEVVLAQNAAGTRADPIIVRDGERGRLIPIFQTADGNEPKGRVAAEIIAWLLDGVCPDKPVKLGLSGQTAAWVGNPVKGTVQILDSTGTPRPAVIPVTVSLQTDSGTGAFDTAADGSFNGSVTSVTVPAGQSGATFFYKDTAAGKKVLTTSAAPLEKATLSVNMFVKARPPSPSARGEVAIYTGTTQWIAKGLADEQAQICAEALDGMDIPQSWFQSDQDMLALSDWVQSVTNDGKLDVLVLYGDIPPDIYPQSNAMPDGSVAELFIESTDGDAIINHADYMFWGLAGRNQVGGLENMMDIPGIVMWDDNSPMVVTDKGREIAPSLENFLSDRPFHVDQLAGDWLVEESLAQNAAGTRADPIIVRDGNRGRLIPIFQTADGPEPKGIVAAEIIAWLHDKPLPPPTQLVLSGQATAVTETPTQLLVRLTDERGTSRASQTAITVNLKSDSATGAFDTKWSGSFNGTVSSLTIPAGERSASFFYEETAAKQLVTLRVETSQGLAAATHQVNVLEDVPVSPGEVAIYTGTTQWIAKGLADAEAQISSEKLSAARIPNTLFATDQDMQAVADWVQSVTGNGKLDVLVLYGDLPPTIYLDGNVEPDGSAAELFLESTDGDAIINHADYMFWGLGGRNQEGGLQNMMDIPGIVMWDDNSAMVATAEGKEIVPSLTDFLSDRPFHIDQLANEWFVEVALAQNSARTRADPIIVRDGNRGRLIPVFQTADGSEPKGAVAAEIIIWLMSGPTGPLLHRGDADNNGSLELTDAIGLLGFLFLGTTAPTCLDAGDADDNGIIELTDAIRILTFLFVGGEPPASPGPPPAACGADPTPEDAAGDLGCAEYTSC